MRTLSPPDEYARRGAFRAVLLVVAGIALSGCHPGNEEAKRLRRDCESGNAAACNAFGIKLLKGEYVLRDDARGAGLLKRACRGCDC